jgi:beta-1,4-mannosyl-glycoprotein beta-1,4-N-acetylglucosaminyltransferase
MKIIDSFLFYNELDLLEVRLNYLNPYVDYFIISEAYKTFNGTSKELYYLTNKQRFKKFHSKIIHNVIKEVPEDFSNFIKPDKRFTDYHLSYPHKHFGKPLIYQFKQFQREVFLKDSQIIGISKIAMPNDLLILGDLDEIPNHQVLVNIREKEDLLNDQHVNLAMNWFMYYFNTKLNKEWFGIRICKYSYLNDKSVDLIRYPLEDRQSQKFSIIENGGWHFSFFGGDKMIKEKLNVSNYQGRKIHLFLRFLDYLFPNRIKNKVKKNNDVLNMGRVFKTVDIKNEFPYELLEIIKKYPHMISKEN